MLKRGPQRPSRCLSACTAVLLSLALLYPALVRALPNDQEQPIHISADKAVRDEKQGFTVYTGDVQMNQGSMYIEADELTIYHINEEADKIVAVGKPAKMRQRPDAEKGPVHARASRIEYFRDEERVHLQTDARIEQDGSIVAGDSIDYFIADQLVKADSDEAREGNRVQVVIPPSVQQDIGISIPTKPAPDSAAQPGQDTNAQPAEPNEPAASPASTTPTKPDLEAGAQPPADDTGQGESTPVAAQEQQTEEADSVATDSE